MEPERRRSLQLAMTALADGDREAFDVAYREALPPLRAYARRILGDGPDAEDATQEALLNLFRSAARFDGNRDALPWILSNLMNFLTMVINMTPNVVGGG